MPSTEVKVNAEFKESAKEEKTVIKMQIGSKTIYVNDKATRFGACGRRMRESEI